MYMYVCMCAMQQRFNRQIQIKNHLHVSMCLGVCIFIEVNIMLAYIVCSRHGSVWCIEYIETYVCI